MKRKILVFTPFIALLLSGCNFLGPRPVLPATSGQSTKTSPTTTQPGPTEDTYGTLDNPISVARAIEIGNAIAGASSEGTVYEEKDAYIKGYVQSEPERGDTTEYRFNVGDSYEASSNIQFYWGFMDSGVTTPIVGDEVVMFGRLANYKTRTIELAGKKLEGEAGYEIEPPLVKSSSHVDCTITIGSYSHGTVTGAPTSAVQNGTKVELTVTPDQGYYVGSVKAYGQTLTEESGKYSFVAYSSTTVTVEFAQGQKSALQEAYEAAIAADGQTTADEYTFSGVVTAISGNSFYVQDGSYGMYVYNKATENIAVSKIVTVTATLKTYNGLPETASVSKSEVTGDGTLPTPIEITSIASISAVSVNMLANVQSAKFVSKTKEWNSSNTGVRGTFTIGEDNVTVNFDKYGYDADKAALFNDASAGDEFKLLNVVTNIYKTSSATTHQLSFAGTSDIISKDAPVVSVTGVKLDHDKLDFVLGGSAQTLVATVEPSNATNKKVTWSVNPTGIVSVSNGSVSPQAVGDAVVTVTTQDGNKTATCNVHVGYPEVSSVTVSPKTESLIMGEGTKTLTAKVLPEQAEDRSVTWSVTSGGDYVSVDQQGVITPKAVGTAVVTATSNAKNTLSDSCTVTVTSNKVEVTSVTVSPKSLDLTTESQDTQLTATVEPNNASVKTVSWSVNPTGVVTVENGLVHVVAAGTAVVTVASTDNPQKSDTCNVTVTEVQKSSLQLAYEAAINGETDAKTFTGTIVSINKNAYVLQDGAYGINVYKAAPTGAKVGDLVEVVSTLKLYQGCPQTNSVTSDTIKGDGTLPTPATIGSQADLDALNHSVLANVAKATFKSKNKDWTSSATAQFVFTIGSDDITISFDKQGHTDTMAAIANAAAVGDEFSFTNVITAAYSGVNQINFSGTATITKISGEVHATSVSFKEASYEVTQGTTKNLADETVIVPANAVEKPTYSVTATNGVTVDQTTGVVTVPENAAAESKATITATITGLEPATCEIVVKAKPSTGFSDTLTKEFFGATGTQYNTYGPVNSSNGIAYTAQCAAGNDVIQLRSSNSNSGVIGGNASYKVVSITITFHTATTTQTERKVDVYGSSTAYSAPSDLYGDTKGTKLGEALYDGTDTPITISVTDTYSFIGIRSNNGALYLSSIVVTWAPK